MVLAPDTNARDNLDVIAPCFAECRERDERHFYFPSILAAKVRVMIFPFRTTKVSVPSGISTVARLARQTNWATSPSTLAASMVKLYVPGLNISENMSAWAA